MDPFLAGTLFGIENVLLLLGGTKGGAFPDSNEFDLLLGVGGTFSDLHKNLSIVLPL